MSFALLALVCVVALAGPALALSRWFHLPVVIGELLVGIVLGATGLQALDPTADTFRFLAEVGFVLVMFTAGTHVPVRDPVLRHGAGRAAGQAGLVAVVALAAGLGIAAVFGTGHGLLYAVLLASSSAAVVLPALADTPLAAPPLTTMVSQIAFADTACIVLLPLAVDPSRAGRAGLGALAVLGAAVLAWWVLDRFELSGWRRRVHRVSEDRGLAIELRSVLAIVFGLAALAGLFSLSGMLAGFAAGLAVSAVGQPRRVGKQVFALTEGLFSPIFFVWLGASLDLRELVVHPQAIALGVALGVVALFVHCVPVLLGQPLPIAALTAAQLGVPVAAAALGSQRGLLHPGEPAALLLGALVTIAAAAVLAPRVAARAAPQPENAARERRPNECGRSTPRWSVCRGVPDPQHRG